MRVDMEAEGRCRLFDVVMLRGVGTDYTTYHQEERMHNVTLGEGSEEIYHGESAEEIV